MCRAALIPAFLACWFLSAAAAAGEETKRVFTSGDGRKFEGSLLKSDGKTATIVRSADRRHFTLPLSALSPEDQLHVKAWLTAPQRQRVRLSAVKSKISRDYQGSSSGTPAGFGGRTKSSSAYSRETEVWQWKITVRNEANLPLEGAVVEYNQMVGARGNYDRKRQFAGATGGTVPLPAIPAFGSFIVKTQETAVTTTKSVQQTSTTGSDGSTSVSSVVHSRKESLDGISVRILYQGQTLAEYSLGNDGR